MARESVKYVNVKPTVEPEVTAGNVKSTVDGAQTGAGFTVNTIGFGFCVTVTEAVSEQPDMFVPTI